MHSKNYFLYYSVSESIRIDFFSFPKIIFQTNKLAHITVTKNGTNYKVVLVRLRLWTPLLWYLRKKQLQGTLFQALPSLHGPLLLISENWYSTVTISHQAMSAYHPATKTHHIPSQIKGFIRSNREIKRRRKKNRISRFSILVTLLCF